MICYNMRKDRITQRKGLREVWLKRNKLGDKFANCLQSSLRFDKYIKVIDLSQNQISGDGMKSLVKHALCENTSLVNFDARYNPGADSKIKK